ncbi:MAG: helix-hairpin-helix domain-containing protein [Ruminococcus sp.]|nr:helix-hairpin-helix domain-containing protein [Ruminococcus sp.]
MNGKRDIIIIITAVICVLITAAFALLSGKNAEQGETEIEIKSESITASSITTAAVTETSTAVTETKQKIVTEPTTEYTYININTADSAMLQKLEGIGEVTAAEIIRYRNEYGSFLNIEEIMLVTGIGEATFEKISPHIYVENPVYPSSVPEPETEPDTESETEPSAESGTEHIITLEEIAPLDINTATAEELLLLPHVNEEIAADIIKLRNDLNGYSSVYELLFIEKLEQKQVAEMAEFVIVGQ